MALLVVLDLAIGMSWHWYAGAFGLSILAAGVLSYWAVAQMVNLLRGDAQIGGTWPQLVVEIGFLLAIVGTFVIAAAKLVMTQGR